jgi:hypothetical protein
MSGFATSLVLAVGLSCPPAVLVIPNNGTPTATDEMHFQNAKAGCKRHFPTQPCLRALIKVGEAQYRAVCAAALPNALEGDRGTK